MPSRSRSVVVSPSQTFILNEGIVIVPSNKGSVGAQILRIAHKQGEMGMILIWPSIQIPNTYDCTLPAILGPWDICLAVRGLVIVKLNCHSSSTQHRGFRRHGRRTRSTGRCAARIWRVQNLCKL
ncbi:hypothetical protein K503DRAFT_383443 [Rhizopogon vinicolor AM-OR11-026]|uniref:Uncharacterized protein n=1 Tax=Rhizopogon vinicolor AM-OR11-026 TaxID=1314800 RepID=A0A1B7NHP2_9AGAM|nr:hypothetical protein K503DRAFT_383443 [Rhizopogon vinicolor AM-OR11-026]